MIPYIINAGLILAGCLAFYKLLLQKETFYKLNRYVLVLCIMVSFSLPLLPVPQQWSFRKAEPVTQVALPVEKQLNTTPDTSPVTTVTTTPGNTSTAKPAATQNNNAKINIADPFTLRKALTWFMYLYWFGVVVFALSFLAQIVVLLYRAYIHPSIKDGKFRIVEVSGDK